MKKNGLALTFVLLIVLMVGCMKVNEPGNIYGSSQLVDVIPAQIPISFDRETMISSFTGGGNNGSGRFNPSDEDSVWLLGPVNLLWNDSLSSAQFLGLWGQMDSIKVYDSVETGRKYPIAVFVDNTVVVNGIYILNTLLNHFTYEGNPSWGMTWADFTITLTSDDSLWVYMEDSNADSLVTFQVKYTGITSSLPESLAVYYNYPAQQNQQAYSQTNLSLMTWFSMEWDMSDSSYKKTFQTLARGNAIDFQLVVMVYELNPDRRVWGVYVNSSNGYQSHNDQELWYLWHPPWTNPDWLVFRFGFNPITGELIQYDDNRRTSTG
jgi:hypothetical protein